MRVMAAERTMIRSLIPVYNMKVLQSCTPAAPGHAQLTLFKMKTKNRESESKQT